MLLRERWSGPVTLRAGAIEVVAFSARSPVKETDNEDGAMVFVTIDGAVVMAVADGCGGMPRGAEAAQLALASLAARLRASTGGDAADLAGVVLAGFDDARDAILAAGFGGATTLAVAIVAGGAVRTFHAGDSFLLVVGQRGKVKLRSLAHAPTAYAVASGFLTETEAMSDDERHLVSNLVGLTDMRVEIGPTVKLAARDTVILGSDGFSDNATMPEITDALRAGRIDRSIATLAALCERRMSGEEGDFGHPDDMTLVAGRRLGAGEKVESRE